MPKERFYLSEREIFAFVQQLKKLLTERLKGQTSTGFEWRSTNRGFQWRFIFTLQNRRTTVPPLVNNAKENRSLQLHYRKIEVSVEVRFIEIGITIAT